MSDLTKGTEVESAIHSHGLPHRGYENFPGVVDELASRSTPAWPTPRRARPSAPNVVVMLMDDMGFSDIGPFGSEIDTPNLDAVADSGYRMTNYQTPPVCSPARAALLTGLNPHRAGFWSVAHSDPGFPGATLELGSGVPTLPEHFRAAGYATFMVGKWHLTKESNLHDAADRSSWPAQRGFDSYYGCMDGFTSLHHPHRLVQDNQPVPVEEVPEGYFLTDDLTDKALDMITGLRANDPDKPFLLYFAHQAVHGPLQAKPEDIAKYHGRYAAGWDAIRADRFRRQVEGGLWPEGTRPAERNSEPGSEVDEWAGLDAEHQELLARYMEVYAAAVDNVDQNLGRLLRRLRELGEADNTIFVFTSDNGATGEGGAVGTRSYLSHFGQHLTMPEHWERDMRRDPDVIGGPQSFVHYPRGWAYASNTPFRLYKAHPHAGGTRVPLLISWPAGLARADGDHGVRDQFVYVSDIGETVMDLAGVPRLSERDGQKAPEPDGESFVQCLRDPREASSHHEQYTEYRGRRAYQRNGWKALTERAFGPDWHRDHWRLYNVEVDPAETSDLSSHYPALTSELAEAWRSSAWMNTVFPLNDDGSMVRNRPAFEEILERPVTLLPGTPPLERFRSSKLTKLRSFNIIVRGSWREDDQGVLVSHGDQGGGYSMYVSEERLCFAYNEYGRMHYATLPWRAASEGVVTASFTVLPEYRWGIRIDLGESTTTLGPVMQLCGMAPFTGISVGADGGGPVDWRTYERHRSFPFTGDLESVRYEPGPKAEYNPEQLAKLDAVVTSMYE